jgi:hypothetical protein
MTAGKNKSERGFRFWWGTADLSGDLIPGSCTAPGKVLDEVDMTGVSDSVFNYLAGTASSSISAKFHMNDTIATGSYAVLANALRTTGTLKLWYGSEGIAPVNGDPAWEGTYFVNDCGISNDGGKSVLNLALTPGSATSPAWTVVAGL